MGEKKRKEAAKIHSFIFEKKNYKFMLMAGGGSDDPNVFNPEIYNWRRIRLAPALILIGFGFEVYAILLNPNQEK